MFSPFWIHSLVFAPSYRLPGPCANFGKYGIKIFVRSQYRQTEKAAQLAAEEGKGIFVVAGYPGIGSSLT